MKIIEMDKNTVINILQTNKAKHVEEYNKAILEWGNATVKRLKYWYTKIKKNEYPSNSFEINRDLEKPESYEKEYDNALEMLKYHNKNSITLNEVEFQQYIKDQWGWKDSFIFTNSKYLSK